MHCCEAFRRHVHQQALASRQLPKRGRVGVGACIICGVAAQAAARTGAGESPKLFIHCCSQANADACCVLL